MTQTAAARIVPTVTSSDRFTLTLTLALLLHALIILGVTFVGEEMPQPRFDTMELTLVYETSEAPDTAEMLAQANLIGGGDIKQGQSPAAMPSAGPVLPDDTHAEEAISEATEEANEEEAVLTAQDGPQEQQVDTAAEDTTSPRQQSLARNLLTNRQQIAALSAEIKRREQAQAEQPRRKFISASTREDKYVAYMEGWRKQVEQVGNLNYPQQAVKRNLTGSLILATALNPDGSVHAVTLRKSSGHGILDAAAIRIVKMAAPYPPLPEAIRKEVDILHITRTWKFINNEMLR